MQKQYFPFHQDGLDSLLVEQAHQAVSPRRLQVWMCLSSLATNHLHVKERKTTQLIIILKK